MPPAPPNGRLQSGRSVRPNPGRSERGTSWIEELHDHRSTPRPGDEQAPELGSDMGTRGRPNTPNGRAAVARGSDVQIGGAEEHLGRAAGVRHRWRSPAVAGKAEIALTAA